MYFNIDHSVKNNATVNGEEPSRINVITDGHIPYSVSLLIDFQV